MRILHITPSVGPMSFGLGQVALNLTREQLAVTCDAQIWCTSNDEDVCWASKSSHVPPHKIVPFPVIGPRSLTGSINMFRAAAGPRGGDFDVVHQHGIWTLCSNATQIVRRRHATPVVLAPHGSLQSWALRRSRWKKILALAAYERANLRHAACLHATAESEVADFRDFGLTVPIAVIPNGVADSWLHSQGEGARFREKCGISPDHRILLFLSRITPKKGLIMLLNAIHSMRKEFGDWVLVIAGTDEFGHKAEVEELIEQLNLQSLVRMIGPLFDQPKRDAFAAAELFVLPSHSEGAPVVVLDSLAVGVPVITTKGAPWEDLVTYDCGWWTDVSTMGLVNALRCAFSLSTVELKRMGERGRSLVMARYSWTSLAEQTIELYEWLLGLRDCPDFVVE